MTPPGGADTTRQRRDNSNNNTSSSSQEVNTSRKAMDDVKNVSKQQSAFRLLDLLEGIGGTVNFSFFKAPTWVDLSLPPGTTSQIQLNLDNPKYLSILTGHSILYSPNLIWIVIAGLMYMLAPYDIDTFAAKEEGGCWRPKWFLHRATINVTVMLMYYGYWHTVLYGLGWSSRPFAQGRVYRWSKLFHNLWYCILGTLQWTAWEMVMVHLYATGRIGYQKDEEILSSLSGFANFFACAITVPVFREIQFFFAHRVIHIRCLYKYIHSLHHRNTDIEPFSGICMSPSEHLYYISSIAPSVYWHASPFQFLWNGVHLILSPGASHSGWEDHWQSDQFHAAHHRYFECNYGTPGMPLDRWFGCFRETLAPKTKAYHGVAVECVSKEGSDIIVARPDPKSTLMGLPSWDQMFYMIATALELPLFVGYAASARGDNKEIPFYLQAPVAALVVAIGPLVLAATLSLITANPPVNSLEKFRYTMFYPYHKESLFGRFGITLLMGVLLSIMPTFHFFHSLFVANAEDTIYNQIWSKFTVV